MKTFKPLILTLIFMLLFSGFTYAQNQIEATLICNVTALQNGTDAYEACRFLDQEPGTDTRDYTIYAEIGDTIIWSGQSTDGSAAIDINKIKYERGTEVFKNPFKDGTSTVVRTIKHSTKGKEDYKYEITLKINNKGKPFYIDPKVRVGGGG
jgi:hypothetical protein